MKGSEARENALRKLRKKLLSRQIHQTGALYGKLTINIYLRIFSLVGTIDLCNCHLVCKKFYELCRSNTIYIKKLLLMGAWDTALSKSLYLESRSEGVSSEGVSSVNEKNKSSQGESTSSYIAIERSIGTLPHSLLETLPESETSLPSAIDYYSEQGREDVIHVFDKVSHRIELARLDYIRVWRTLAPIYRNLAYASNTLDPIAFSAFQTPEEQAVVLKLLLRFGNSKPYGWFDSSMQNAILDMAVLFEQACLDELALGIDSRNLELVSQFSHVLHKFSAPNVYIQLYLSKQTEYLQSYFQFDPYSLFVTNSDNEGSHIQWGILENVIDETIKLLTSEYTFTSASFPVPELVEIPYARESVGNCLKNYVSSAVEHIGDEEVELYLIFISGLYRLCKRLFTIHNGPLLVDTIFQSQVDIYISQELHNFKVVAQSVVDQWDMSIQEKEGATESFFFRNVGQNTAKNNFLETFKNVMLLPVSLFSFPSENNEQANLTHRVRLSDDADSYDGLENLDASRFVPANVYVSQDQLSHLPTTELAAQAAVLDSKLEGISSMFSLELALKIVHLCKISLARTKIFLGISNSQDEDIQGLQKDLFVQLLRQLGQGHLKHGFDRAIEHLSLFDPRKDFANNTVEPIVKFLELINVGDLIQQMMDTFYNEEMSSICVRDDMFDPAIAEKKKFEQLLDERAAYGLHKGIDVIIEHVDFLLESKTPINYFCPQSVGITNTMVEPSVAAKSITQFLRSHMRLLVGCTDHEILDVFYKEVGMRLFNSLTRYIKQRKFTVEGGLMLLSDLNMYYEFVVSLKQRTILPYFKALKEIAHLFIIDGKNAEEIGKLATDNTRFSTAFHTEEVYEMIHCRIDWLSIKYQVDKVIHGLACCIM
ncbi:F-box protein Pof6 [Schizosaccharomyces cryophilus OY26]|uniref:F-box protein Pof6 n=1 Tax=Schizosaccharomyces cryophilus (strain OY26 / ATCC MYA-4695 / CBS 11777 / NBRC 106824 / NRRL Y48691) TaxID=653667 RepID=S9VYA3_SCHCR|nr:F-box protein Pof6 [Schizosaccharomyces cryophilus OY26]EPY51234.1 F-box protein Pof6 [Schizosaccharomyces cryophilus OY26]